MRRPGSTAGTAVFIDDALAGAAAHEMTVEFGPLAGRQIAEYEVEGAGMGQLDIPLSVPN
jgi:hypothetical protein